MEGERIVQNQVIPPLIYGVQQLLIQMLARIIYLAVGMGNRTWKLLVQVILVIQKMGSALILSMGFNRG